MSHNTANMVNETYLEDPEFALAQRYGDEIRSLLAELWTTLPAYRKQIGDKTYRLVRENLDVLTACFNTSALNVHALGILRDHLWTLLRMLGYRVAELEHQRQYVQDDENP